MERTDIIMTDMTMTEKGTEDFYIHSQGNEFRIVSKHV